MFQQILGKERDQASTKRVVYIFVYDETFLG